MVEQRDRIIDEGIGRLADGLRSAKPDATANALADTLIHDVAEVIAADDDIALLVMRFSGIPASVDIELPPDESALAETQPQAAAWMLARGVGDDQAAATLRAVGEAVRGVLAVRRREAARHPAPDRARGRRVRRHRRPVLSRSRSAGPRRVDGSDRSS